MQERSPDRIEVRAPQIAALAEHDHFDLESADASHDLHEQVVW